MGKKFMKDQSKFANLLVVDSLNLAFRWKWRGAKDYSAAYMATVQSLANSYEAEKVIILGDGGSTYREGISADYKANRKEMKANQTEAEAADFKDFFEEYLRAVDLLSLSYDVLRFKGVEADDIAAYIVKHYSQDYNHTWLISSDKDWDLLIKDDVSRFTTHSRKEITLNNWGTHYSYPPHQHISVKAITGDSGDNVAGVPGIGEKRAAGLLREYESALDVHAALPIPGSQKFIQSLNEFKDNILINYELMDLLTYCDVAVLDNTEEIDEVMNG